MSHKSIGRTKIKNTGLLKEIAESMGLKIKETDKMKTDHIGTVKCDFVISDGHGGELAVVDKGNGEYEIQMDNYYNTICDVVGESATLLTREYITEAHKLEAQLMGATVVNQEVDNQGFVFLEAHV